MIPHKRHARNRIGLVSLALFAVLLVNPLLAAHRLAQVIDPYAVAFYVLLSSGVAYWFYYDDKKSAVLGTQRTPESLLHGVELLGGWPGAFLAQRLFRHKIVKQRFQIVFWAIVALHEFAAFDFVRHWHWSAKFLSYVFGPRV